MTILDWIDVGLLSLLVISTIASFALLIVASFHLARTRRELKRLENGPVFRRDVNGRPLRERK